MNTSERFVGTLTGRPVDRVPFMKVFGGTNGHLAGWEEDCPGIGQCIDEVLQFEGEYRGWQTTPVNQGLCGGSGPSEVIEDTDVRRLVRTGLGQEVVEQRKGADYHQHRVAFAVQSRGDWDTIKAERLNAADPARFPDDWAAHVQRLSARECPLQLTHGGVYGFARNLMGDEGLCMAFYDDPGLVHDMMDTFTDCVLAVWEKMTADVAFDLIECWEDMAGKNGSIVGPGIFREFMTPNYRKIRQFADAHGIEIVLVDSDGNIERLTEWMLDAGVTALYPYEVQAGNDVFKMLDAYPTLGVVGGLNKESMAGPNLSAAKDAIDREMEKAAHLIAKGRFIPGPDHFVLSNVRWESYQYFMEQLRQVVMTTPCGHT